MGGGDSGPRRPSPRRGRIPGPLSTRPQSKHSAFVPGTLEEGAWAGPAPSLAPNPPDRFGPRRPRPGPCEEGFESHRRAVRPGLRPPCTPGAGRGRAWGPARCPAATLPSARPPPRESPTGRGGDARRRLPAPGPGRHPPRGALVTPPKPGAAGKLRPGGRAGRGTEGSPPGSPTARGSEGYRRRSPPPPCKPWEGSPHPVPAALTDQHAQHVEQHEDPPPLHAAPAPGRARDPRLPSRRVPSRPGRGSHGRGAWPRARGRGRDGGGRRDGGPGGAAEGRGRTLPRPAHGARERGCRARAGPAEGL